MASFDWPPRGGSGGLAKVANSTARLALTPNDGDVVIQLDNDDLYAYNQATTSWLVVGSPSGVAGPGSATNKAIARFNGTTGLLIQNSLSLIDDSGNLLVPSNAGVESLTAAATLNIGSLSNTTTLNLGTNNSIANINIGTGTGAKTINIGASSDTVNIAGTHVIVNTTDLAVSDKNIQLNANASGAGTARGAGINVRDSNTDNQGYLIVDGSTGTKWQFKAPEVAGIVTLIPGASGFNIDQGVAVVDSPTFAGLTLTSFNGVVKAVSGVLSASALVNADVSATAAIAYSKLNLTGNIVNADINASAAIAYSKLSLTASIVNADINASAGITYGKLNLASSIVNSDIAVSAAIAYSKLSLTGSIVNADISASAAIVYSKLSLTNSIVNGDISGTAAIAYSKLSLTNSIVNADISSSAAIVYSKLSLTGSIVNADISSSAAIGRSKIAAGSINQVVINDGSGNLSSEAQLATTRGGTGVNSTAIFPTSGTVVTENSRVVTKLRTDTGTTVTVATTDHIVKCTSTSPRTVNLPSAPPNGFQTIIKDGARNASSNNITITAGGTDTIEGSTTLLIESDNGSKTLVYDSAAGVWEQV